MSVTQTRMLTSGPLMFLSVPISVARREGDTGLMELTRQMQLVSNFIPEKWTIAGSTGCSFNVVK